MCPPACGVENAVFVHTLRRPPALPVDLIRQMNLAGSSRFRRTPTLMDVSNELITHFIYQDTCPVHTLALSQIIPWNQITVLALIMRRWHREGFDVLHCLEGSPGCGRQTHTLWLLGVRDTGIVIGTSAFHSSKCFLGDSPALIMRPIKWWETLNPKLSEDLKIWGRVITHCKILSVLYYLS